MAKVELSTSTEAFLARKMDGVAFGHRDHLRVAFDLLRRHDFIDATTLYAKGIRSIAASAGVPEKFNTTMTYAFMSLIAERLLDAPTDSFDAFLARNPDLMESDLLYQWYYQYLLRSDKARRIFLLPRRN